MSTPAVDQAKILGGTAALLLGVVCLDFLPPLGLAETLCAVLVLVTRRPGACWAAVVPTSLILGSAAAVMITVSGWANPLMWPVGASALGIDLALVFGATAASATRVSSRVR